MPSQSNPLINQSHLHLLLICNYLIVKAALVGRGSVLTLTMSFAWRFPASALSFPVSLEVPERNILRPFSRNQCFAPSVNLCAVHPPRTITIKVIDTSSPAVLVLQSGPVKTCYTRHNFSQVQSIFPHLKSS